MQNDRLFEISQSNQSESEKLLGQIRQQTEINHGLDSEYRINETNILHTKEMIAAAEGAKESVAKSMTAEEEAQTERAEKIVSLQNDLAGKEEAHLAAQAAQKEAFEQARALDFDIDRALSDIRVLEAERASVDARISVIENSKNTDTDKNTAMLEEIGEYEARSADMTRQCDMARATVADYDRVTGEAAKESEALASALADLYRVRHDDNEELTALRLRRDSAQQRIDTFKTMEEQFEGYSGSVRHVMKKYKEGGITDRFGHRASRDEIDTKECQRVVEQMLPGYDPPLTHESQSRQKREKHESDRGTKNQGCSQIGAISLCFSVLHQ